MCIMCSSAISDSIWTRPHPCSPARSLRRGAWDSCAQQLNLTSRPFVGESCLLQRSGSKGKDELGRLLVGNARTKAKGRIAGTEEVIFTEKRGKHDAPCGALQWCWPASSAFFGVWVCGAQPPRARPRVTSPHNLVARAAGCIGITNSAVHLGAARTGPPAKGNALCYPVFCVGTYRTRHGWP